jgi:hypothetical protein
MHACLYFITPLSFSTQFQKRTDENNEDSYEDIEYDFSTVDPTTTDKPTEA